MIAPTDPLILVATVGAIGTVLVAAIGVFSAFVSTRKPIDKAAIQQALNDGFSDLTDQLQEERNSLQTRIEHLEDRVTKQERIIRLMEKYIRVLETTMHRHKIPVPDMPEV